MARPASSFAGTGKVMPSGSQLVSTMAATGMLRRFASLIASCSLFVSITKIRSGVPPMSLMPPSARSSFSFSRESIRRSFFVRPWPPVVRISSTLRRREIEPEIVFQFVSMPPSQRALTKYCAERFAASAIASEACRFVPTKSTRPPFATVSLTAWRARCRRGTVCARSMMWMLFRVPKMYCDILGFQRWDWWPKWAPASRS